MKRSKKTPMLTPVSELMAMSEPIERVALRYFEMNGRELRGVGGQRRGLCPAHDDRRDSWSVGEREDKSVMTNCFASCTLAEQLAALQLPVQVLFPHARTGSRRAERLERQHAQLRRHVAFATSDQADELCDRERVSGDALDAFQVGGYGKRRISTAERDGQGNVIGIVTTVPKFVRAQGGPTGAKSRVLPGGEGRGLVYPAEGIAPGSEVIVVEGLACALAAQTLGFIGVGIPTATRPLPERWAPLLTDCDVVVIGDNDDQGQQAAHQSAVNIVRAASTVRIGRVDPRWNDIADVLRDEGPGVAGEVLAEAIELAEEVERPKRGRPASSLVIASDYLRAALAHGQLKSSKLIIDSRPEHVSERTLKKARDQLGVVAEKRGRQWMLSLPEKRRSRT